MRPAVFLDRDGVINRSVVRDGKPFPPETLDAIEILPGVPEAMAALKDAGFLLIVVTNQPDVATGKQKRDVVEAIHAHLSSRLPIDDIRVCYDIDSDDNFYYKPKPGMLMDAAEDHGIDLGNSYMVGDRWRDVGAGNAAGCFTLFIDYGYREKRPDNPGKIVRSLAEASDFILSRAALQNEDVTNGQLAQG